MIDPICIASHEGVWYFHYNTTARLQNGDGVIVKKYVRIS